MNCDDGYTMQPNLMPKQIVKKGNKLKKDSYA